VSEFPREIRLELLSSTRAGLLAVVSDDLPGLMVVAETFEELTRRLPVSVAQLIKAQYGVDVTVEFCDEYDDSDFKSLSTAHLVEARAA
jgi:hypothetical protein